MRHERDTSPAAAAAHLDALRRIAPSERARMAFEMSEEARALAADGERHRHRAASEAQVEHAVRRSMLGGQLADRVDSSR